jgi:uncharacterized 2Fe-2S/4Fe-4S cluster protein (DUF4445 family)
LEKYNVTIMPENNTVTVSEGTSLLLASKKAGIYINSPCGGQGTCGKCAVKIINGFVDLEESSCFPQDLKDNGYIPACRVMVDRNITVEIPMFSRLTKHKVILSNKRTKFSKENDYFSKAKMNPICKKLHVKMNVPDLMDNMNDTDRLLEVLDKQYDIKEAKISIGAIRNLPSALRQGRWEVTVTIANVNKNIDIIAVEPGISNKSCYGLAIDIGTTTVAVNLLDLTTGKIIDKEGTYNKQTVYGSDVISRIIFTDENPDGLDLMQKAVVDSINELIDGLVSKNELVRDDISAVVCAGNTVMSHMFMRIPATFLRLEPYIPAIIKFPVVKAKDLNLNINSEAVIIMVPSVASYVGGDITAGVLATMLSQSEKVTLFIDIGTNGELVLGNSEWLVTCSCSAGPAFEGSGISCGMRAMDGAIDRIEIDRSSLEVKCRTVGSQKPLGICGSGLIYALSEMNAAGIIDRAGKILGNVSCSRIRLGSEGIEYILAYAAESGCNQDIVITEGDIKNLLRAKAAMFAGIRTMLQQVQLDVCDIERIYIAGGFGNFINITDAINIGLLPDLPLERFEYVGNSSVQGAMIVLLCVDAIAETEEIIDRMTYLELSVGNLFMEEFVSATFIPHTDLSLFPTLRKSGPPIKLINCT